MLPEMNEYEAQDRLLLALLGFDVNNRLLSGYEAAKQFIQAQSADARAAFKRAHPEGWTPYETLAAVPDPTAHDHDSPTRD